MVFNAIADFDPEDFSLPETSLSCEDLIWGGLVHVFELDFSMIWIHLGKL